jgi:hypothetical protein
MGILLKQVEHEQRGFKNIISIKLRGEDGLFLDAGNAEV